MVAPNQSPYDGNPLATPPIANGYRPTPADFNGASLTNLSTFPPNPATMPTAELLNTTALTVVSHGKMVSVATFGVNAGASPTMEFWSTAALLIVSNPFAITRNGVGDYSITWAANLFPIAGWPRAMINALIGATNASICAVNITNGVRVQTTQGGALTDLNFSVAVY